MFDRSHFMIFDPPGAAMLAAEIDDFARRIDDETCRSAGPSTPIERPTRRRSIPFR